MPRAAGPNSRGDPVMVVCERQVQTVVGFTHPAVTAAVHYGQNSFKSELESDEREIAVTDARRLAARPSLDDYGFLLTGPEPAVPARSDARLVGKAGVST